MGSKARGREAHLITSDVTELMGEAEGKGQGEESLATLLNRLEAAQKRRDQAEEEIAAVEGLLKNHSAARRVAALFSGSYGEARRRPGRPPGGGKAQGRAKAGGDATPAQVVAWFSKNGTKAVDECQRGLGLRVSKAIAQAVKDGSLAMVGESKRTKTRYKAV